ncbi:hypothetical protein F5Y19DRAFT_473355 [Xylariaceae sp. FL1651]|nr:hypothetical protein F5Y19DRAFT_473355 [Xylariaceae sp. FL1651]
MDIDKECNLPSSQIYIQVDPPHSNVSISSSSSIRTMKTSTATAIVLMGAAHVVGAQNATSPGKSFKVPVLDVGWANACQGADTLVVTSTPKALTWRFTDFGAVYPSTGSVLDNAICVMMNDIGSVPARWRFTVDNVQTSGSGTLTGGAVLTSLWTTLSMDTSYMINPLSNGEHVWASRSQSMGSFNLVNTTLVSDGQELDGKFDVQVKTELNGTNWSPCWPDFVDRSGFRIQFNHQTHIYIGQTPDAAEPKGRIDNNLQVKLNLKWEACDPNVDSLADWGEGGNMPSGWSPYQQTPKAKSLGGK